MRIAVLISSLRCGGTEKTVSLLANAWAESGDEVSILTLSGPEVPPFFPLDSRVRHCPLDLQGQSPTKLHGLLNNLKRVLRIRRALEENKPEVLVAFMEGTTALGLLSSLGLRIPVVLSEVAVPHMQSGGKLWNLMRRCLYPLGAALVVPSAGVQKYFVETLRLPCSVIANPVQPIAVVSKREGPGKRLLAVGRLSAEKGFDALLHAVALLREKNNGVTLTIFGEGPLRSELEALRKALGLENCVSLPGTTPNLAAEFANFDIFVLSSHYEGFGNVLCEAMAAGLPVVSYDCPTGPREIIRNGIDGILVPAQDRAALVDAVDMLLNDTARRKTLAGRAPEIVQRFGLAPIAGQWRDVFRNSSRPS